MISTTTTACNANPTGKQKTGRKSSFRCRETREVLVSSLQTFDVAKLGRYINIVLSSFAKKKSKKKTQTTVVNKDHSKKGSSF